MKAIVKFIPNILSFLLLAAHFSRADQSVLSIVSILLIGLMFIRKRFVRRVIQIILLAGAVEWVRSMLVYINQRIEIGEDWIRLMIIMLSVSLFTVLSALLMEKDNFIDYYRR